MLSGIMTVFSSYVYVEWGLNSSFFSGSQIMWEVNANSKYTLEFHSNLQLLSFNLSSLPGILNKYPFVIIQGKIGAFLIRHHGLMCVNWICYLCRKINDLILVPIVDLQVWQLLFNRKVKWFITVLLKKQELSGVSISISFSIPTHSLLWPPIFYIPIKQRDVLLIYILII